MTNSTSHDILRNPFGEPQPTPPPQPRAAEDIYEATDYGAIEQDVFLLKAHLLNID